MCIVFGLYKKHYLKIKIIYLENDIKKLFDG